MKKFICIMIVATFSLGAFANRDAVRSINNALDEVAQLRRGNPKNTSLMRIEDSLYDALNSLDYSSRQRQVDPIRMSKDSSLIIASFQCRDVRADVASNRNVKGFMREFAQEIESFEQNLLAACRNEARFPRASCDLKNMMLNFEVIDFNRCRIVGEISPR